MSNAADIPELIATISAPRLNSYRAFFQPQTDEELLAIYRWHEDLCTHFNHILKWVEVAMRNGFHVALSAHYGVKGVRADPNLSHCADPILSQGW